MKAAVEEVKKFKPRCWVLSILTIGAGIWTHIGPGLTPLIPHHIGEFVSIGLGLYGIFTTPKRT